MFVSKHILVKTYNFTSFSFPCLANVRKHLGVYSNRSHVSSDTRHRDTCRKMMMISGIQRRYGTHDGAPGEARGLGDWGTGGHPGPVSGVLMSENLKCYIRRWERYRDKIGRYQPFTIHHVTRHETPDGTFHLVLSFTS